MQLSNPNEQQLYERIRRVAVTGTRHGMTKSQRRSFKWLLSRFKVASELIHGDCTGVDVEAAEIAHLREWKPLARPSNLRTRAHCPHSEVIAKPKDPIVRNKDIVDDGDCVVACPKTMSEELRSGTWAAVRYARSQDALLWIVWPNGSVTGPLD